MTNQFAQGEPLTYDRLNELIKDVSELKKSLNKAVGVNENYPRIDVVLFDNSKVGAKKEDLGKDNKIQIFAGIETINVNKNTQSEIENSITFGQSFGFNRTPIVICNIEVDNFNKINSSVQTSQVKGTGFKYKITLESTPTTLDVIKLHYIAIGRDAT